MTAHAEKGRSDYYRDYWRAPELATSEHVRWKVDVTHGHPLVASARAVLDVGCGSGQVLEAIRRPGLRVCGVEMDEGAARSLELRGIEGRAVDLEAAALPFAEGEFDVVLCYDVLEHVFAPGRLLDEIGRVAGATGHAFVCVPNVLNLFNRLLFLAGDFVDVMDTSHRSDELFSNHIRLFSKRVFERLLARAGLRVLERHYYFPERFSDSRFRAPPWLARVVTKPALHERWPSALALGFLYVCARTRGPAPGGKA